MTGGQIVRGIRDDWVGGEQTPVLRVPKMQVGHTELKRILVVGSINVDLYQSMPDSKVSFGGERVSVAPIKGMTLPAANFVANPNVAVSCGAGGEEALVLTMDGPFEQKTGGKGANAAAAAGQSFACELIGNFGAASAAENEALLADLGKYGAVGTSRCAVLPGVPTGTAYILLFPDNDNAILLLGGANQVWPAAAELCAEGGELSAALGGAVCVMLQREVPPYVNVAVARLARARGVPVLMDVGGTDDPIDPELMPHLDIFAPNESELTFTSGVETRDAATGEADAARVRDAVAALRAKFAAAGNERIELLVTLGAQGSLHFGADGAETRMGRFALASTDGRPVDTTGAGDCYRGSFAAARYGLGKPVVEAMRWAAAAGSLAVEVKGAMPSMPSAEAIAERAAGELF